MMSMRLCCGGLVGLVGSLGLAGCGVGTGATTSQASLAVQGNVHGGDQPVSGATIGLYVVGAGGNGSQATNVLTQPVTTDRWGAFTITGEYTCPSATSQVYLVARGGNPGLPGNVNNAALVMMSALGDCASLNASTMVYLNEISTVAAGYALAPFTTAYDHVGASATNLVGIRNAFLNARLLADPSTGRPASLPLNLTVETGKLLALADALASCVNSAGGTACAPLLTAATPAGGVAPTDTVEAVLNIVKNPANHVAAVFNAIPPMPPYATSLSAAPNDWTMSLTVTGGGLDQPMGVGVDQAGNVWAASVGDPGAAGLVAFSPQGTAFAGSPFGAGLQTDAYGLTVDKNGDVWVPSSSNNPGGAAVGSVAKFAGASRSTPGALLGQFSDATLQGPEAIASDPAGSGSILLANSLDGSVTRYNLSGAYLNNLGQGSMSYPSGVVSDGANGAWITFQNDSSTWHLLANGTASSFACCDSPSSVALDAQGNVWMGNNDVFGNYSVSAVNASGSVLVSQQGGGGLNNPMGTTVDAGGHLWVANEDSGNFGFGSISEITTQSGSVPMGTAISPAGGLGLDAMIMEPYGIAADASGNVWVSDEAGNALVMFFGLATPTATPATPVPSAP